MPCYHSMRMGGLHPKRSARTTCVTLLVFSLPLCAQPPQTILAGAAMSNIPASKNRIVLDTDIGDDVDDAFALALALSSPELEIVGITTAWGDTHLRTRLVERFLTEAN